MEINKTKRRKSLAYKELVLFEERVDPERKAKRPCQIQPGCRLDPLQGGVVPVPELGTGG